MMNWVRAWVEGCPARMTVPGNAAYRLWWFVSRWVLPFAVAVAFMYVSLWLGSALLALAGVWTMIENLAIGEA